MRLYSGVTGQARERLAVEAKVEPQTAKLETVSSARVEEIHVDKPQTQPIKEKPEIEPRQQNHSAAVQLTLLDLWGMPIEEPVKKKRQRKEETRQNELYLIPSRRLRLYLLLKPPKL